VRFPFSLASYFEVFALRRLCVLMVAVFFLALNPADLIYAEDDIHGSAHLTHTSTETETGGDKTSTWQFTQVYNVGLTKALTPKVGFSADLDVNVTESNDEKTTRLAPDLRLDMTNE